MLQRGDTARSEATDTPIELVPGRYTHQTEDTRMDRDIVQTELTCQPVREISGYNGEYDT